MKNSDRPVGTRGATTGVTGDSLAADVSAACHLKDQSCVCLEMVSIVVFWLLSGLMSRINSGLLHRQLVYQVCLSVGAD